MQTETEQIVYQPLDLWTDAIYHDLYACVDYILREQQEVLVEAGLNHPAVTAGKITGMIIEAYHPLEVLGMIQSPDIMLGDIMADAVFTLMDAARV